MIVINARFLTQKVTGVQRYAIELSRQLKKLIPNIIFVSPRHIENQILADELGVIKVGFLSGHTWEQIELPVFLKKNNALLINLCNTAPVFYKKNLVVIHDVAFERFPKNFSVLFRLAYKTLIPRLIERAKFIVTVSDFSKQEIIDVYGVMSEKINCIPCAVGSDFSPVMGCKKESAILAVSSLSPQKNFLSLIKAFNLIDKPSVDLYIVGDSHKNFSSNNVLDEMSDNPNIKILGRVSDSELVSLYSTSLCFVYPSFYEGFGLPPLEAQACGCPCLVANAASLPEVLGDSALFCDPHSIEDIKSKLKLIIDDEELRQDLIRKGKENINRFSWKNSAVKMKKLIDEESSSADLI